MKIIDKLEPETSDKILQEYEQKYKIPSDIFYKTYKLLQDYETKYDLIEWIFEYEINRKIKHIL